MTFAGICSSSRKTYSEHDKAGKDIPEWGKACFASRTSMTRQSPRSSLLRNVRTCSDGQSIHGNRELGAKLLDNNQQSGDCSTFRYHGLDTRLNRIVLLLYFGLLAA